MSTRSSVLMLIAALAACMGLAVCGALLVGGYFVYSNHDVLGGLTAPAPLNRIAFVGNDSNIYVADPSTGATTAITQDGGTQHTYNYPTWSPDSRRLAFVGYTFSNGNPTEGILFTAAPSGEKLTPVYKTPENFPFYLYWSPDSRVVAFLSNKDTERLALSIARSDQPDSVQEMDTGAPFYWAWAPDSSQMFTHVGGTRADSNDARLALLPFKPNEQQHPLDSLPGSFQAPQWTHDGKILYSTQQGSEQAIALRDAQTNDTEKLITYRGRASFALSPDGTQVAYVVTESDVRLPHFGPLRVIDLKTGNTRLASEEPVLAFLWSPDSARLAFLTVTVGDNQSNFEFRAPFQSIAARTPEKFLRAPSTAQGGELRVQLHWKMWESAKDAARALATFIPTPSFLNVVPYFDQYANSSTFWSPDSQSFVYTARSTETGGEVWVADATGTNPPRKIGEGVIAFWSWK